MYIVLFLIYWIESYLIISNNTISIFYNISLFFNISLLKHNPYYLFYLTIFLGLIASLAICFGLRWIRKKNKLIFWILFIVHLGLLIYLTKLLTSDLGGPIRVDSNYINR